MIVLAEKKISKKALNKLIRWNKDRCKKEMGKDFTDTGDYYPMFLSISVMIDLIVEIDITNGLCMSVMNEWNARQMGDDSPELADLLWEALIKLLEL